MERDEESNVCPVLMGKGLTPLKDPSWPSDKEGSGLVLWFTPGTQTCSAFPVKPMLTQCTRAQLRTGAPRGFSWQVLRTPSSPNQFILTHMTSLCSCRVCWLKLQEGSRHYLPACRQPGNPHPHHWGLMPFHTGGGSSSWSHCPISSSALLLVSARSYSSQQHRA